MPSLDHLQGELELLAHFGEREVFDLCVELDFIPREGYELTEVLPRIIDGLASSLATAPIPVTKYDAAALAEGFAPEDVQRLARAMGLRWVPSSKRRALGRVVRLSARRCRELPESSPFRWMVPILLPAVVRRLGEGPLPVPDADEGSTDSGEEEHSS